MDLVSVIMPSYNSAVFIKDSINSVLCQTYTNWELIIVDDFSIDDSKLIISDFMKKDERIKAVLLESNIGPAEARNIALDMAKGKYIAFLDSDDLWIEDKIDEQIKFMKYKDIAFSYTSYQPISEDMNKKFSVIKAPDIMTYDSYLKNTIIGCLTVMIDKSKTGSFKMPNIRSSHDMALWLILMKRGFSAYGLNKKLAYYRIVNNSNTSNKFKSVKDVWMVYTKIEKINVFNSFWYFICYLTNAIKKRI